MKVKVLLIAMCLFVSSPVFAEWDTRDKTLMGSYITLSAIDAYQTSQIDRKGLSEGNPLLVNADGQVDMGRVIGTKLVALTAVYLLAEYVPKYRTPILSVAVGIQGACVAWNLQF